MYRMASTIARRQCFSGRPPRPAVLPGAGNSGSRTAHSASVTDDEYTAQPCPPAAWGGHDGHGEIGDDGIVGSWSGRGLGNHRPNQEPTSSILREAHAAHRRSQTLSYTCSFCDIGSSKNRLRGSRRHDHRPRGRALEADRAISRASCTPACSESRCRITPGGLPVTQGEASPRRVASTSPRSCGNQPDRSRHE
jgi:hypothetical protein